MARFSTAVLVGMGCAVIGSVALWSQTEAASQSASLKSFGALDMDFQLGEALFERPWVSAPASTLAADGLGPLFNARSCVACHADGGRGEIRVDPDGHVGDFGFVIRLGSASGRPDPTYGVQLQTNAIQGHVAEGQVSLVNNAFVVTDWAYGPLDSETRYAGRLSQSLHGLGLLDQVTDAAILANADPQDENGDGISGRPNWVETSDGVALGRFGWKATAPTLLHQSADAFLNDIGMSSPLHPQHAGECTAWQDMCQGAPHGDSPQFDGVEISGEMLRLVTHYVRGLPAPENAPSSTGLQVFTDVGCAACHMPALPLPDGGVVQAYTDLLLHDMGPGLADGIREGEALGSEWRTQPLWGTRTAERFLHDGRALSVREAIEWHGGEAASARARFLALPPEDQTDLLQFVESL